MKAGKSYVFILSSLVSLWTVSVWGKSFYCSEAQQITYKNINCCLSEMTADTCQQKIDGLSERTLQKVETIKKWISAGKWPAGFLPNCHWNALEESGVKEALQNIDAYYPEMAGLLERDFVEISKEDLKKGDLVAVWFQTKTRMSEDGRGNKWHDTGLEVGHSAIYIGDDMVFQKESASTDDFSIQNIDLMYKAYDKGFNSSPLMKKGSPFIKYYRRK